jgi:hypothetical protein
VEQVESGTSEKSTSSTFPLLHFFHLLRFFMRGVLPAEPAVLVEFQPIRRLLLVLGRAVVPPLALPARQLNDISHKQT